MVYRFARAFSKWVARLAFREPIFILSTPRSGSSHLQALMDEVFPCWGSPRENDGAWWRLFPYESNGYTDSISLERFRSRADGARLREELAFSAIKQRSPGGARYVCRHALRGSRFLDKTVANAFHLEVLAGVFPDARYVYLVRDGRETIASMIEGWLSGSFMKRRLPFPEGATVSRWTYPVPPGWERVVSRPLPEICAWSWMEHHRSIRQGIERLGLGGRRIEVRYEELVGNREGTLAALADALGFEWTAEQSRRAIQIGNSWTTISAPRKDKWRDTRAKEIEAILPLISETMIELGYDSSRS